MDTHRYSLTLHIPTAMRTFCVGLLLLAAACGGQVAAAIPDVNAEGMYPVYFERNQGQAPGNVIFLSRGMRHVLGLSAKGASVVLQGHVPAVVHIFPVAAAGTGSAGPVGVDLLPGTSHYFTDGDPEKWVTNIEHFRKVRYPEVYPGVDMVFHGDRGRLEFDFVLQPGQSPETIALRIAGVDDKALDRQGNLVLRANGNELILRAPVAYQFQDGMRVEIPARFHLRGNHEIGFEIAAYDRTRELVIDPVLVFSSYVGGSANDLAHGVALDGQGNIYVVGETYSTDFPTHNPYQATAPVNGSAFVMKLDAQTRDVVYATYVGSNVTMARGIAVDATGSAYIVGDTSSTSFPLVDPYQAGRAGLIDIFVSRLSPAGDALTYSTYLGGDLVDRGRAIAVDDMGDVYIAGVTSSTNFPLVNPIQTMVRGSTDAYVAKLSPSRGVLDYSTYMGGGGLDYGASIDVGMNGNACVGGFTTSANFPLLSPLQGARAGPEDAFVACFAESGSLSFSTYLGGAGVDRAHALAMDATGNIHLAGETTSTDFPAINAFQPTLSGTTDAFALKLNAAGTALLYSTYLGGAQSDIAYGVRPDSAGNAYLAGMTSSNDFPLAHAVQAGNAGGQDAFVAKLSVSGDMLGYSTYLGGIAHDYARELAVDAVGNVTVVGVTESGDFPVTAANQPAYSGGLDAFIAVLHADAGQLDITDLLWLLRFIGGLEEQNQQAAMRVDMNHDGSLDVRDVLLLQRSLWAN